MPRQRAWPARNTVGQRPSVEYYDLESTQTFKRGDPVVLDGSNELIIVSGADPASILGFASEDAADVFEALVCGVWLADETTLFAMEASGTLSAANKSQSYGIVVSSGVWIVDLTDTTNLRVYVQDIDVNRNLAFCKVLEAVRQTPA